jgi:hypothetical protein
MTIINNGIKINEGQLCKIINEENRYYGYIVKFVNKAFDTYNFKTIGEGSGKLVKINNKDDFMFLPYEGSIMAMIDLAIDTKDDEWLQELYNKLIDECELETKK